LSAKVAWLTPTGTVQVCTPPVWLKVWVAACALVWVANQTLAATAITAASRSPRAAFSEMLAPISDAPLRVALRAAGVEKTLRP
jgi:hypothetical protein